MPQFFQRGLFAGVHVARCGIEARALQCALLRAGRRQEGMGSEGPERVLAAAPLQTAPTPTQPHSHSYTHHPDSPHPHPTLCPAVPAAQVFGSMLSTPIINPPQSAILGMHATNMRPAVVNGQIVARCGGGKLGGSCGAESGRTPAL